MALQRYSRQVVTLHKLNHRSDFVPKFIFNSIKSPTKIVKQRHNKLWYQLWSIIAFLLWFRHNKLIFCKWMILRQIKPGTQRWRKAQAVTSRGKSRAKAWRKSKNSAWKFSAASVLPSFLDTISALPRSLSLSLSLCGFTRTDRVKCLTFFPSLNR